MTQDSAYSTGNNPSKGRSVLSLSLDHLITHGYHPRRALEDRSRNGNLQRYAWLLYYEKRPVYLTALSQVPTYKPRGYTVVSTQYALVNEAAQSGTPILLSVWPDGYAKPMLRVYEAKHLHDNSEQNTRFGVQMLNYEYDAGTPLRSPADLWRALEKHRTPSSEGQIKIEDVYLNVGIVKCGLCGAEFSSRFPKCPACNKEVSA